MIGYSSMSCYSGPGWDPDDTATNPWWNSRPTYTMAEQRRARGRRRLRATDKGAVLAYVRSHPWATATEVRLALGVVCASAHLSQLYHHDGRLVRRGSPYQFAARGVNSGLLSVPVVE